MKENEVNKFEIDCYIESIISESGKTKIIVKGDNGYRIERNSKLSECYNCFWSMQYHNDCNTGIKLFSQVEPIEMDENHYKIVELSYLHRKKVKLIVDVKNRVKIESIKTV